MALTPYERDKRWRKKYPEKARARRQRNYAQTQGAPKSYQPWTQAEIKAIIAEDRPSDRELSAKIGRSVQAIQLKRMRVW